MSTWMRRLIYLLLGIAGGFASWPAMELAIRFQERFPTYLLLSVVSGALFGAIFGLFFGLGDGVIAANTRRTISGGAVGFLWGLAGGAVGFFLGQWLLLLLGDFFLRRGMRTGEDALRLARILGWAVLGVFVGTTEGIRKRSGRKLATGLLAGFLGGALGGLILEYSSGFLTDAQSRPVGLILFGALVALAYGLVEKSLAFGILRLLNGPFKGKEFILNQRSLSIGAAPSSDVPLFDYNRVMQRHAVLKASGQDLSLVPGDPGSEVKHNDRQVPEQGVGPLKYGDVIQFGNAKLLYLP
mgnify:FL=1